MRLVGGQSRMTSTGDGMNRPRSSAGGWTRRGVWTTILLLAPAGCSLVLDYEDGDPAIQTEVRVFHGALGLDVARLEVGAARAVATARFPEASRYVVQRVAVRSQTPAPVEVVLSDADTGEPLAVDDLDATEVLAVDPFGPSRQLFTIHLWRSQSGELRALALRDDPTPSDAPDHMRLRLVNLVPDQGEIFVFRPPNLPLIGQRPGRAGPYGDFPLNALVWGFDLRATDPRAVEVVGRTIPWSSDDVSDAILVPTSPDPDTEPAQLCVLGVDEDRRCYPLNPRTFENEDPA
jgi:hypothetical protein